MSDPTGRQHAGELAHVPPLRCELADVLDHVVREHDVERAVREGERLAVVAHERVALAVDAHVGDIDARHGAARPDRVGERRGDRAAARADVEQPCALDGARAAHDPQDLLRLRAPRGRVDRVGERRVPGSSSSPAAAPTSSSAYRSQESRARAAAQAGAQSRPSASTRSIAAASAGGSDGGASAPVTPSSTSSGRPPTAVATTGRSKPSASAATPDWLAERYGSTMASAAAKSTGSSSFAWKRRSSRTQVGHARLHDRRAVRRVVAPALAGDEQEGVRPHLRQRADRVLDALVGPHVAEGEEQAPVADPEPLAQRGDVRGGRRRGRLRDRAVVRVERRDDGHAGGEGARVVDERGGVHDEHVGGAERGAREQAPGADSCSSTLWQIITTRIQRAGRPPRARDRPARGSGAPTGARARRPGTRAGGAAPRATCARSSRSRTGCAPRALIVVVETSSSSAPG